MKRSTAWSVNAGNFCRTRCQYIANFRKDLLGYTQLDRAQLNQSQTCARRALASGGALKKYHTVEKSADLRAVTAHQFGG